MKRVTYKETKVGEIYLHILSGGTHIYHEYIKKGRMHNTIGVKGIVIYSDNNIMPKGSVGWERKEYIDNGVVRVYELEQKDLDELMVRFI